MPQYVGQVYVGVSFDTAGAGRALGQSLGAAANQAGNAMNRTLSEKMLAFGTQATRVGRQLSFGISAPLLALGHAADTAFQSYDTQMTKVAALTGTGIAQTNEWSNQVLDLAASYGQTGEDAAKALYLITSSGIKGADAMKTLDVTGQAAAVGLGDMQTIAGLLTSAMNAYGTETLSAAKAADILAGAVQESKVPADQLAGSISQLLPIASQLGIGFDQVVGSMAALSLQGTNAAMGATQLRGILNGMLDPSSQAAEALQQVGLSVQDVQKTMESKGIVAGVRQIRDAIVANGGESDEALAEIFGNVRALTGVFGLLNDQGGKVGRVLDNTTNSAGKLAAELRITADTPGFKARQATQELNNEMVKLGASITPIKTLFAQAAGAALSLFNSFGPFKQVIVYAGAFLAVLGPIAYSIGAIADVAGLGAALLAKMGIIGKAAASEETVATNANTEAMGGLTVAIETVTAALLELGGAGETAMGGLGGATIATEEAMATLGGVGANAMGPITVEIGAATAEMEGLAAATAQETAELGGASVAAKGLMASLLPIALIAASIGAVFAVVNNRLRISGEEAESLGDIFANNVAGGGIQNAQDEIEKTKKQIDELKADADGTWNPFTKQADADAAVALGKRIAQTQQNLSWVDELSKRTDQNKEVTFQWLQA
jgi:TP901 family phage tail tape measure protein